MSPLSLAFVGDAVQTLYVRAVLVKRGGLFKGGLHRATSEIINAVHQADITQRRILPLFNETESGIYKRGRNSKNSSVAKNSGVAAYKKATGFEAVIGFLYLTGQTERLNYILSISMEENL